MFARKSREDKARNRAKKRMRTLDTPEILNWADQCGTVVATHLAEYRKHRDPLSVTQAQEGLSALSGVVDELAARAQVS